MASDETGSENVQTDAGIPRFASLAERQIAHAQRDLRLEHGREGFANDWWGAMESAERVRRIAEFGARSLMAEEARVTAKLQASGGYDDTDPAHVAEVRAARQRTQIGKAEIDNEFPEMNAMTLVAMVSATDALIEALAPATRELSIVTEIARFMSELKESHPSLNDRLEEEGRRALIDAARSRLEQVVPLPNLRPDGVGAKRWERALTRIGLQARPDRRMPGDMDQALAEIVTLRHVIAHRAARVDKRALKAAPTLPYAEDELVRLSRADYRRYSAALWTYGQEVVGRIFGPPAFQLNNWHQNYTINS